MTVSQYADSANNTFGTVLSLYRLVAKSTDQKGDLIALVQPVIDAGVISFPVVVPAAKLADLVIAVGPVLERLVALA